MSSRREFFKLAGIAGGAVSALAVGKHTLAGLPEPVIQTEAVMTSPSNTQRHS